MKPGRNDPCPCGSGKKYKNCCLNSLAPRSASQAARRGVKAGAPIKPAQRTALKSTELNRLVDLFNAGGYVEMESRARALLERNPDSGAVWKALGLALHAQGKEALPALHKAVELMPQDAEAHNNLGKARHAVGQFEGAAASFRRALEINPDSAQAHCNLGAALHALCRFDEAAGSYRRALEIKPDYAKAYSNLGAVLDDLGLLEEAVNCYRQALAIEPNYAEAHSNLGNALRELGRLDDAVASHRRALEIKPDFADAYRNLGVALRDLGRLDEAMASWRSALAIRPDYADARSNLLFLQSYHALADPDACLAEARAWEQACVPARDRQKASQRTFQRAPLAGRRLKVGYVSGDYRQHAVSYFVEQLFAHHNRAWIELYAYSSHGLRDAITERLQALAEHWVALAGLSDSAIRERIEMDGIDVLIDLSGHTEHNRLGVFARRAAPVQAHYLGFFGSTGLTEMDYWIGDEILTPAEIDSHFSEHVWRLPRVWVSYDGKAEAPVPDWRPSQDGKVWLGSFNALGKLTPATLALWAKLLNVLPQGNLLLKTKALDDMGNRRRILDAMSELGISSDRIELQGSGATPDWPSHMAYYDRLDLALDPAGAVGGGTTSCDALWMGVPVITLEGDRVASRMTASMLNAIDHPEWIAHSDAEYIHKAVALARDVGGRKALRAGQRKRMAASPLCDARDLAMSLENAYFEMFRRWFDARS